MLTLDSQGQAQWRQQESKESAHERRLRDLAHEIESNTISVSNDDRYDVSNVLSQMGRPMMAQEIQRRLKLCNSRLHFIRSPQFPDLTGVYLITDEVETNPKSKDFAKKLKHICGMQSGITPEFSVLHRGKKRVPNKELLGAKKPVDAVDWVEVDTFVGETRGWRTVLVRLLHAGLITRHDVNTHFGWMPSRDSAKWFNQTK